MAPDDELEETRPTGHGRARGLVSSRVSGGRVHARTFAPSPPLCSVVQAYWTGRWDLREQEPHVTQLLADPSVNLVFETTGVRVVGVWTRLWHRTLEGRGHVRGAKLHPGAVQAFVTRPAWELTNRMVPLADVFGPGVHQVAPEILVDDEQQGCRALERWLATVRQPTTEAIRQAMALVAHARNEPSLTRVDTLAARAGLGVRAVQRLFRDHVGAPPKFVIRRFRLQEAALAIERGDAPHLADLAHALGYADQAHLARDFKAAAGRTLRTFERDLFRGPGRAPGPKPR